MIVVVIPSRYASVRLPAKPLALIAGKPMIQRVYERAILAKGIDRVIVATDDKRIEDVVKSFGGDVVMTGDCRTGTDRVAQAVKNIKCDLVVNVQGDEPLMPHQMIEQVVEPLKGGKRKMSSLKRLFRPDEDPTVPSTVKVVVDDSEDALYFSRSLIPYPRGATRKGPFCHVGIYAFAKDFLMELSSWSASSLEEAEGLEQLRVLERGIKINVPTTEHFSVGVDTPDDLARVEKALKEGKV